MSKLTVSIKKSAAAHGHYIAADTAARVASHIEEGYVIIPKSDLPEVHRDKSDGNTYRAGSQSIVYMSEENAREWCLRDVAVWQFIANEESGRRTRRDDLARELSNCGYDYLGAAPILRTAIDRIIQLESERTPS